MPSELFQRIRAARLHKGLSQAQLGKACGVERAAVNQWEALDPKKRTTPRYENLRLVSEVTGAPMEWLLNDDADMEITDWFRADEPAAISDQQRHYNVEDGPDRLYDVPLISWVQAGAWQPVADPYQPGDFEELVKVDRRYSNMAFALRVNGDSMQSPHGDSFPPGSIIIVEPDQAPRNGSYVVVRLEDEQEATFKQLVIEGSKRYLKPLNPRYPIIEVTSEATICGVVRQMVMHFE